MVGGVIIFDPDKPIENAEQDVLHRQDYSKRLGEAILNYDGGDSLVIGLQGKWGHGKTSVINMALDHINTKRQENNDDKFPIIIKFNPWLFSGQNQLIKIFFDELILAIKEEDKDGKIGEKLKSYVDKIIPPIIGVAAVLDPQRTQSLLKSANYVKNLQTEEESLDKLKNEINDKIRGLDRKIIVIIDDIDRLSSEEIRQTFKLVKLLADFPNTIYLLSFDRSVVVKALGKVQGLSGEEYLKKVVQIHFEVPNVYQSYIEQFLFEQLNHVGFEDLEIRKWWVRYRNLLKLFFNNLRDVKLFINALQFNYEIIKDEVNPTDFLAITSIQVFENDVYQDIRNNKSLFTTPPDYACFEDIKPKNKSYINGIIKKAGSLEIQNSLIDFLTKLFPNIRIYYNIEYLRPNLTEYRHDLLICSPDFFDAYFMLSIPESELSHIEMNEIISGSKNKKLFSNQLLSLDKRVFRFLERLNDYIPTVPNENFENIVMVLMDIGDDLLIEQSKDQSLIIIQLIKEFLHRFRDNNQRFEILKKTIQESNSIYLPVALVESEIQMHDQYNTKRGPSRSRLLISFSQLKIITDLICKKIEEIAYDNKINDLEKEKIIEILHTWKKTNSKTFDTYLKQKLSNDNGLMEFISWFLVELPYPIGSPVKYRLKLELNEMEYLWDLNPLAQRVKYLLSAPHHITIPSDAMQAMKIFLKQYGGRIQVK